MSEIVSLGGEDYFQIQNLIHSALYFMDTGNEDSFADMFFYDQENPNQVHIEIVRAKKQLVGIDQVRGFVTMIKKNFEGFRHFEYNVVITAEPMDNKNRMKAKNISYWSSIEKGETRSYGEHFDTFIKVNGVWKFYFRKITHVWSFK